MVKAALLDQQGCCNDIVDEWENLEDAPGPLSPHCPLSALRIAPTQRAIAQRKAAGMKSALISYRFCITKSIRKPILQPLNEPSGHIDREDSTSPNDSIWQLLRQFYPERSAAYPADRYE